MNTFFSADIRGCQPILQVKKQESREKMAAENSSTRAEKLTRRRHRLQQLLEREEELVRPAFSAATSPSYPLAYVK